MTDHQENKISRNKVIETFFTKHLSELSPSIPILSEKVNIFKNKMSEVHSYGMVAFSNIKGYTEQKKVYKEQMFKKALSISACLSAYFMSIDDDLNYKLAKINITNLKSSSEESALFICESLLKKAQDFRIQILSFGVSSVVLNDFEQSINKFRAILTDTAHSRSEKLIARHKFVVAIKEADVLLEMINNLMGVVADVYPLLYIKFKLNLRIGKTRTGKVNKPNYIETIKANETKLITELEYEKKTLFKIHNQSKHEIKWGLSEKIDEFSQASHLVKPHSESKKLSSTLAPIGNFLLIENVHSEPVNVRIWVEKSVEGN